MGRGAAEIRRGCRLLAGSSCAHDAQGRDYYLGAIRSDQDLSIEQEVAQLQKIAIGTCVLIEVGIRQVLIRPTLLGASALDEFHGRYRVRATWRN